MKRYLSVRGGVGDLTKADTSVRPQDNLYLAVNSAWQKNATIPADRTEIGVNTEIDMRIEKRVLADLDELASKKDKIDVPNLDKAIDLYKLAKNFKKRDADGAEPIKKDLRALESLTSLKELNKGIKHTNLDEILANPQNLPFSFEVEADMKNTKVNVLEFAGPGTFLPDTTSYKQADAPKLLTILSEQTIKLLTMAGVNKKDAREYVKNGLAFDQKLAKVVKSTEEWSDYPACYNLISYEDFVAEFKTFDMAAALQKVLPIKPKQIIVMEPRFLEHAEELINENNFAEIKGWMIMSFINDHAHLLSQAFREAAFPFNQALTGQGELAPVNRHAYYIANASFSEPMGIYYGKKYLGADAKADVTDMIHKMIKVYESRIKENTWLSEATKQKAITKLKALVLKIGYPDKQEKIYDLLQIDPNKSLYENERNLEKVVVKYNLDQLTQPVDRTV